MDDRQLLGADFYFGGFNQHRPQRVHNRKQRMNPISRLAQDLGLREQQVQSAADLLAEGNTIPFITRYRKEWTGSLDEVQLRSIEEGLERLKSLEERRAAILKSIAEQDKLDDGLQKRIEACDKLQELEDLYLPYRPKRRTRASVAREKGLEPLAAALALELCGRRDLAADLPDASCPEPGESLEAWRGEAADDEEALAGAADILAEWINEDAPLRASLRESGSRKAALASQLADETHKEAAKFRLYAEFSQPLARLKPHQVLALNRGEKLGVLKLQLDWTEAAPLDSVLKAWLRNEAHPRAEWFRSVARDALDRLALPALGRDLRRQATEAAESHSLEIFAANLKQLLLQPPLPGKVMLGLDPGFRTGCKVAVIDGTGRYLEGDTLYPHPPKKKWSEAKLRLLQLIESHKVELIAIGNGTASRESEELFAELIRENELKLQYAVVSEAGASVYSASDAAREEFPELDASLRGNISIARRLQDPLAELVKIDPKSLGVGQYQHDVDSRRLGDKLGGVVEDTVNAVGVDLNTASAHLLAKVSGVTRRSSRNIVAWRDANGAFRRRDQLMEVEGIGPAAFRQCAGFLRIRNGENELDNTAVHPEAYEAVSQLARRYQEEAIAPEELARRVRSDSPKLKDLEELAGSVGLGLPTLRDILDELARPGRDPRSALDPPMLRSGALSLEQLKPGTVLDGTVRNLVDFGAFVDVGLKEDGLVHVSQLSHKRVNHPVEVLSVGERVQVQVLDVDLERQRISLSIKALQEAPERPRPNGRRTRQAASGKRPEGGKGQGGERRRERPAPQGALQDALRKALGKEKR